MYDSQTALIANYINPIIGDMEVQAITPRVTGIYRLCRQQCPYPQNPEGDYHLFQKRNHRKDHQAPPRAVKQAVRWELAPKNPFDNVVLPKVEYKKRDIWIADMIRIALDKCTDSKLYVAMNPAFACLLRMGKSLGLPKTLAYILREWKSSQGDTGHAEIDMITSIYAHVLDEDRKVNAQKFETAFYANPDLRGFRPPQEPKEPKPAPADLTSLAEQLQKSPELASALAALIAMTPAGR